MLLWHDCNIHLIFAGFVKLCVGLRRRRRRGRGTRGYPPFWWLDLRASRWKQCRDEEGREGLEMEAGSGGGRKRIDRYGGVTNVWDRIRKENNFW